jgi:hypothetical protein
VPFDPGSALQLHGDAISARQQGKLRERCGSYTRDVEATQRTCRANGVELSRWSDVQAMHPLLGMAGACEISTTQLDAFVLQLRLKDVRLLKCLRRRVCVGLKTESMLTQRATRVQACKSLVDAISLSAEGPIE